MGQVQPSSSAPSVDGRQTASNEIELNTIYNDRKSDGSASARQKFPAKTSAAGRLFKQVILLLRKNWLMQTRSFGALMAQLFIGVILLGVLRAMQNAIETNPFFALDYEVLREPTPRTVEYPAKCYPHDWFPDGGKKPQCYSFVVSPNTNDHIGTFAKSVAQEMATEAGFNAEGENRGYYMLEDEAAVDSWLYANQNATPVAVIFKSSGTGSTGKVSYTLQYNHTRNCNVIGVLGCTNPKQDLMAAFQRLVDQSVLRINSGVSDAKIDVEFSDFPHPPGDVTWDVMRDYGAQWIYIALMFNMIVQLFMIATEKEKKLRDAMAQMGMMRSAYWVSWFISCEIINVFVVLAMCAFGYAIDMEFFRENGFEVFFLLFFLTMTTFTMMAFFFSTLIATGEQAQSAGIVWLVLTYIVVPILVRLYFSDGADNKVDLIWGLSLISSAPFFKGTDDLIAASSGGRNKGMLWDQDGSATKTAPDIDFALSTGWRGSDGGAWYSVSDSYKALGWCCLLYAVLCWYFDHVVPNQYGLARSPFFFLNWRYWANASSPPSATAELDAEVDFDEAGADEDVVAEQKVVASGDYGERKPAVIVSGLKKKFESRQYDWLYSSSWAGAFLYGSIVGALIGAIFQSFLVYLVWTLLLMLVLRSKCCCGILKFRLRLVPTRKFTSFTAVKGVSYAIEEDSLFVLLGHNGAGKSTTFNMMTGLMPLTAGDATIFGMSVRDDMDKISTIMGFCPQHDVLWDHLSGREHLELFARLKNIPEEEIHGEVEARLKDVKLENAADVRSGRYSGGMQRRLSLAIALLGDPKVIFLDEPTTGMDPVTRRSVWDCINRAKKGRVIVLTTHSMEEADILGDNVAVMSGGRLQAFGTSLHLKNKYGGGFRLSLLASNMSLGEEVKKFVLENITSQFVSEMQGVMLFRLASANDAAALTEFFGKLEGIKEELGILDVSIGNATLDDVFINLALQEEVTDETKAELKLKKNYRQAGPQDEASGSAAAGPDVEAPPDNCTFTKCLFDEPTYYCDWGCGNCCKCCCDGCCSTPPDAAPSNTLTAPTESTEEEIPVGRTGAQTQLYALVRKNLAFQMRQKKLMCGMIFCWSLMCILIGLLGTLVFGPMTEASLAKWKWSCVQDQIMHGEHKSPRINVGGISDRNDQYKNDDWPPLYSQESASYQFFVGGPATSEAIGTLTYRVGEASWLGPNWRKGRKLLAISDARYECERKYDTSYEKGNTYIEDKIVKDDMESMYYAETWLSHNWSKSDISYKSRSCNVNRYGKNITTTMDGAPSNATLWEYKKLQHSLRNCQAKTDANPTEYFTNATYRDQQKAQIASFTGSGLVGNLTFNTVDLRFAPIFERIVYIAYYLMPGRTYCASKYRTCEKVAASYNCEQNWFRVGKSDTCDWVPPAIANGTQSGFYNNMATYLCNIRDDSTTYAEAMLKAALTATQGTANSDTVDAFCRWVENMDGMQGTEAVWAGTTRKEFHETMWKDWGGTYDSVTNTHRTKFTSYYFETVDQVNKKFAYTAYYNLTGTCAFTEGADVECESEDADTYAPNPSWITPSTMPLTENMATIQASMNGAIFEATLGVGLDFDTKTFPLKLNKCAYDVFGCVSINDFISTIFLPWIFLLNSFIIIMVVVFEKATHLRDIMIMSGLKMRTYWAVLWVFYFAQFFIMMLMLWFVANFVGLRTFTIHSPVVVLVFLIIWGNCMVAFSFLMSSFFKSVVTAICVTFLVILITIEGGTVMIVQLLTNPAVGWDETPYLMYMWFPPLAMLRCLMWLVYGAAFNSPCTLENLASYGYGSILRTWMYMIGETIAMIPLTFYFESILGEAPEHPCFPYFALRRWWKSRKQVEEDKSEVEEEMVVEYTEEDMPEDVKAEQDRVLKGGNDQAVRVMHFRKVFPSTKKGIPDKVAVHDLSFGVNKNECFGLLGHNGAGKTTTISMLCGLFRPTSGKATVVNFDLIQETGKIHERMGVCPQHDILWNDLTAAEHLQFYGRLRKIPEEHLKASVDKALDAVNLLEWANVLSSKFSGGMKRRLSTACSLVGDPEVVYMDEPSTGLDPASRHRLWDVIAQSKGKNSILLTTHSMEEADLLCDRIGIMGDGKMMCVGTAPDLKRRFGAGYKLSINLSSKSSAAANAAQEFVKTVLPSASLLNEPLGGVLDFEVPRDMVQLSAVYAAVEKEREALGIVDWALSETTLEEVFLKVTGHADDLYPGQDYKDRTKPPPPVSTNNDIPMI